MDGDGGGDEDKWEEIAGTELAGATAAGQVCLTCPHLSSIARQAVGRSARLAGRAVDVTRRSNLSVTGDRHPLRPSYSRCLSNIVGFA
ncbi:hypothetical protein E2C01_058826 [Portunus trituberculatus]|uniref:Uncharacterized protein n=1 Tax=Portunus trituberculatus TaxID=210409 RepID=A0A5B7H583_PORTR|nr:hypothetical protein [Portunus trituberculatus]